MAKQAPQEAGGLRRLPLLLSLLHLPNLGARLVQREILHQNRLSQFVNCVRVASQSLPKQLIGVGIFLRLLCFLYLTDQIFKH